MQDEQQPLDQGLARIHDGRLIPVIRGGAPDDAAAPDGAAAVVPPEPSGDPLAAGRAAGAATDAAADPEAADPEAAAAEDTASAAPAFDPDELAYLRERQDRADQILEQIAQRLGGGQPQQAAQQPQPGLPFDVEALQDPLSDGFGPALVGFLAWQGQQQQQALQAMEQRIAAPMQQQARAAYEEHLGGLVDDMIADEASRNGDLTSKQVDTLNMLGAQMLPDLRAQYGDNPDGTVKNRVLELAVERSAALVREMVAEAVAAATGEQTNRLAALAGARGEPGPGATGGVAGVPEFGSPGEVVDYYASRARQVGAAA